MFSSLSVYWQKIKCKFNKIFPIFCTFVLFYNFSLSAFAIEGFYNAVPFHSPVALWVDGKEKQSFKSVNSYNVYQFSNSSFTAKENIHFTFDSSWELVRDSEHFDYYLYIEVDSQGDFNFNIQDVELSYYVNGVGRIYVSIGDFDLTANNGRIESTNFYGYRIFAPFPSDFTCSISSVRLLGSGSVAKNVGFSFFIIQVPKGSNESVANSIIDAINNQTDFIVDGDDSTGGIVSSADSSRNELESIVNDYQNIENSMLDNFTLYQSDILSDVNGWSWGGLSLCANWVGDTMTSYFQNMGDFKQYIVYPLLLGIALFFIGRGSSIIGHLYRKPTNIHTDTVVTRTTVKNGNTSNTVSHTDTYRAGGVLRK